MWPWLLSADPVKSDDVSMNRSSTPPLYCPWKLEMNAGRQTERLFDCTTSSLMFVVLMLQ